MILRRKGRRDARTSLRNPVGSEESAVPGIWAVGLGVGTGTGWNRCSSSLNAIRQPQKSHKHGRSQRYVLQNAHHPRRTPRPRKQRFARPGLPKSLPLVATPSPRYPRAPAAVLCHSNAHTEPRPMATANTYVNVKRVFNTQPEATLQRPTRIFNVAPARRWCPRRRVNATAARNRTKPSRRQCRRSWASSSTWARS